MFRHYFSESPTERPKKREIEVFVRGFNLRLVTYSGIFSYRELDKGTKLLAESMIVPDSGNVLDLGCGYGVIGIIAGLVEPGIKVYFVDINPLAIIATKQNAKRYLDRARFVIKKNDGLAGINETFSAVYSNPPFSAGKETVFRFVEESFEHLNKGGWLEMVARGNKGGRSLQAEMERVFGNVEIIARGSGYKVYHSVKE